MNTTRTKDRNNTEKTHQLGDSGIKEKYGAIENSPNEKVIKCNGTDIHPGPWYCWEPPGP
jgi:hypothetical protein